MKNAMMPVAQKCSCHGNPEALNLETFQPGREALPRVYLPDYGRPGGVDVLPCSSVDTTSVTGPDFRKFCLP